MPAKLFLIPKKVEKSLTKLPLRVHKRIPELFLQLRQNPFLGEKLHGELSGFYKYRLGDYRIVYTFDTRESRLEIVSIEHRQGAYKLRSNFYS